MIQPTKNSGRNYNVIFFYSITYKLLIKGPKNLAIGSFYWFFNASRLKLLLLWYILYLHIFGSQFTKRSFLFKMFFDKIYNRFNRLIMSKRLKRVIYRAVYVLGCRPIGGKKKHFLSFSICTRSWDFMLWIVYLLRGWKNIDGIC